MLISQETQLNQLPWNDFSCIGFIEEKKPYLTYDVIIECKNLNPVKLSKKQINLYNTICDLKDKGLTYKQISNKLNELGYQPARGKVGEFTPQKVWSNYTKIKKNSERKIEVLFRELTNIKLLWE